MSIGKRLCNLRKRKKMTQTDLANLLYVTDKTISSWESNRTEPSLEILVRLSEVLECSIGYLVYGDVSRNDIETEIKIKITENDYKRLNLFFKKEAKYLKNSKQLDTYYQPTYRNFLNDGEINEWLRIGERGNKKVLNYKNWHNNTYCDEYEVEIDDSENLDKIFHVLGLEKIAVVDKDRVVFFYLDKYEISLDNVKNLGYFIEIEVKNYTKEILDEYSDLLKLAKDLGLDLNNIDKRGYPYHMIYDV